MFVLSFFHSFSISHLFLIFYGISFSSYFVLVMAFPKNKSSFSTSNGFNLNVGGTPFGPNGGSSTSHFGGAKRKDVMKKEENGKSEEVVETKKVNGVGNGIESQKIDMIDSRDMGKSGLLVESGAEHSSLGSASEADKVQHGLGKLDKACDDGISKVTCRVQEMCDKMNTVGISLDESLNSSSRRIDHSFVDLEARMKEVCVKMELRFDEWQERFSELSLRFDEMRDELLRMSGDLPLRSQIVSDGIMNGNTGDSSDYVNGYPISDKCRFGFYCTSHERVHLSEGKRRRRRRAE